jgi:predicted RNase H-like nuclease (RuvC/YqgF family)
MTKTKTKTKTKMPKLRREASPPTQREWNEYSRNMVQYVSEQLARKDAQIAALKRQNKALQREVKRLRMDPLAAHDAAVAKLRATGERLALPVTGERLALPTTPLRWR